MAHSSQGWRPAPPRPARVSRRPTAWRRVTGSPLQQGHLDGLCGLYAIINAIALLTERGRPFPLAAATALYRDGIDFVVERASLAEIVCYGFDAPLWLSTARHLAKRVQAQHRVRLSVHRPFQHRPTIGFAQLRRAIEAALDDDAVVLASLTGAHNHYTVIRSYTASRFVLHDSSGLRWLSIAACSASYGQRRHQITAAWLTVIKVDC